jgi:hypothetical protein
MLCRISSVFTSSWGVAVSRLCRSSPLAAVRCSGMYEYEERAKQSISSIERCDRAKDLESVAISRVVTANYIESVRIFRSCRVKWSVVGRCLVEVVCRVERCVGSC